MKFLGLNSPGIFIIALIILTILGPKRIEKGWFLFKRLLKFLLSKQEQIETNPEKAEANEVKNESLETKPEKSETKKSKKKIEPEL